jgi:SOS response regulatory protein OraA/RecX
MLLRYAIGDYIGDRERADALVDSMHESGGYGKPVIDGFDHFSISHSGNTWAVLISSENCGFDIEYYRYCKRTAIAKRFFAPEEAAAVRIAETNGPDAAQEVFFAIWTRREALVKALGISVAHTDLPHVTGPSVTYMGDTWYFGSLTIPGSGNLSNSICVKEPLTEILVKEIRFKEMEKSKDKKSGKNVLEEAYSYISARMRTVREVEKHLSDKGFGSDEIREAVNELIGGRYLDDYQYAVRYFEHNREKKRGSLRAARELAEKGVDRETIENAREDFIYENKVDEYGDALELAKKELALRNDEAHENAEPIPDEKIIGSIGRKLESRGFSRSDIFRVLEKIRKGDPE